MAGSGRAYVSSEARSHGVLPAPGAECHETGPDDFRPLAQSVARDVA